MDPETPQKKLTPALQTPSAEPLEPKPRLSTLMELITPEQREDDPDLLQGDRSLRDLPSPEKTNEPVSGNNPFVGGPEL